MKLEQSPDVVIVGAGIAGSALAHSLACAGLSVLLLEKTLEHKDVVRGEWLAPWGAIEVRELGLTALYEEAGAHRPSRHINYEEFDSREVSEAAALDMGASGLELPICIGHPRACDLLNEAAESAGATLCRGIRKLEVRAGSPPRVSFDWQGETHEIAPRLVVAADGRAGSVSKQLGVVRHRDPEHHRFAGMLVADAGGWPQDLQVIATEGDAHVLAFPQGGDRVRVYLGFPKEDSSLVSGSEGAQRFLDSWRIDCVPHADAIAESTPIGPAVSYSNADSWVDSPVREGVVLIGDAAGHNDPIIGQGLSIAHRDVRQVRDALLGERTWSPEIFGDYVRERRERMARLRIAARLTSLRAAAFGSDGRKLRQAIHERMSAKPELAAPFAAAFFGPEILPAEVFDEAFTTEIVGHPIWADLP
jgi:2-polyprenyl-6-methoxyphenol hydroxylase-like FAD-dependent oxidoreductase